jgi:O-antigen ligase
LSKIPLIEHDHEIPGGFARFVVPYIVGLAAPLLVAIAWSPSGNWTPLKGLMVGYSIPIVGAELFAIAVALREGLAKQLKRWTWTPVVAAALAILLIVAAATAVLAPQKQVAITLTAYWIVHGLFAISIAYLTGRVFEAGDLVKAYMAGFAIFAAEFLLFVQQVPDWATFNWTGGFMAFPHIRHAGYYLAAMAALGIGAMAVGERRGAWLWAWASAAAATAIAMWTGSRGGVLAIAGALVVGSLVLPALRSIRSWAGALSAMAAGLAAAWIAPAAPSSLMGLIHAVRQTTSGDVTTGRTTIWKNVIAAIEKHPLFGYGEGQMHWVAPFSTMAQPHNSILQVALAWGLVGLACVAILAIAFAWRAIPAVRREGGAMVPVCLAMTAVAILSLYDASLYYALPQSIFMASAGMVASRWGVVRPTADRSASRPARSREATWSDSATEASASSGS